MEKQFRDSIISIQGELKAPKNQRNNFGKYNYRSAEDILEAVKPLLQKYSLLMYIEDKIVMIGDRYYVQATASISDGSESLNVTAFAREEDQKKGQDASQLTGSTSSYARKYALNGLFCIDDDDGDVSSEEDVGDLMDFLNELFSLEEEEPERKPKTQTIRDKAEENIVKRLNDKEYTKKEIDILKEMEYGEYAGTTELEDILSSVKRILK